MLLLTIFGWHSWSIHLGKMGHSTESTRTKVHREIEEKFPVEKKFYRNLKHEEAEEWMEEIIKRNELRPRDHQSPLNLETQPQTFRRGTTVHNGGKRIYTNSRKVGY